MNKLLFFTLLLFSVFTFASCKDDDEENNVTNETEIIDEEEGKSEETDGKKSEETDGKNAEETDGKDTEETDGKETEEADGKETEEAETDNISIFIVTGVLKVADRGVVATGNVQSGNIKVGDVIYIYTNTGDIIETSVKSLSLYNKSINEISEGDSNAAILLDALTVSESTMVPAGSIIATSKSSKVASAKTLMVDVNFEGSYTDLPSGTMQLYNGGSDYTVAVKGISLSTNGYAQRYCLEVYSSTSDSYFAPIYNGCEITLRKEGRTYATGIATIVK